MDIRRSPVRTADLRSCYAMIRGIVLLKLTTERHEASRGLSATADLIVWTPVMHRYERFFWQVVVGACCSKCSHEYLVKLLQASGRTPVIQVAHLAEGIHRHNYLAVSPLATTLTCCLSNAMHGQNIHLPVSVCLCVRHTFCQLAYR